MNVSEKLGPWTTSTPSASVPLGNPTQSAASTPAQVTRSCSVGVQPAPPQELIMPNKASKSHEITKPKIRARNTAIRAQKPGKSTAAHTMKAAVSSATHWSWGQ